MLKNQVSEPELFRSQLSNIINLRHPLCQLADSIDWSSLHENLKYFTAVQLLILRNIK